MGGNRASDTEEKCTGVAVASASAAGPAVTAALAMLGESSVRLDDMVVLLSPPPTTGLLRDGIRALAGSRLSIARPRSGLARLASNAEEWQSVALPAGARRFDRVGVPSRLLGRPLVLASPLPTGGRTLTPIGVLAAFAHPRQQLAARFGGDPGALAELAAPLRPGLVLLTGQTDDRCLVALTHDLIAAELVARALLPAAPDAPGPWEHPAVQRATELDLGARTPAAIRFLTEDAVAAAFVASLKPRIGVA